jgi:hypothetical protein
MENQFTEEVIMNDKLQTIGTWSTRTLRDASAGIAKGKQAAYATVLVIANAGLSYRSLITDLFRLGRRAVTARSPLGAIVQLQDHTLAIDLLLAPSDDPKFGLLDFFTFVKDEFPHVRRIAYAKSDVHAALGIEG